MGRYALNTFQNIEEAMSPNPYPIFSFNVAIVFVFVLSNYRAFMYRGFTKKPAPLPWCGLEVVCWLVSLCERTGTGEFCGN